MEDTTFKALFQRIVDQYELAPDAADRLLQRILEVLQNETEKTLQSESKYEMLIRYLEREEML